MKVTAPQRGELIEQLHVAPNVETVRDQLTRQGACLLRNLDASSPARLLEWAARLGSWDLGIDEELLGPRIMHMRYDPRRGALTDQPVYFTSDDFPLHTDVSYVSNPPGLVLLHCVQSDSAGGGQVLLANCDEARARLAPEYVQALQSPVFRFLYPPACPAGASAPGAILSNGRWRFKFASMEFATEYAAAVNAFHEAMLQVCQTFPLQCGDMLIIDNHRLAHGRTAFRGTGRHIMRCYVNPTD